MAEVDKVKVAMKVTKSATTEYIVLQGITLKALGATPALLKGSAHKMLWVPVLNQTAKEGPDGQPRIFKAAGKTAAIRQHTGDGADVVEGDWKAVPLSSWRGGESTRRVTAADRTPLEDGVG